MSIDTTFQPIGATTLVGVTALQLVDNESASGVNTFRVRCLVSAYLTWGKASTVAAAGAPVAGTPSVNTIGMVANAVAYIQVPPGSYFISSVAAAFEVTPGNGGTGG